MKELLQKLLEKIMGCMTPVKEDVNIVFHGAECEFLKFEEIVKDIIETAAKEQIQQIKEASPEQLQAINKKIGSVISETYGLAFPDNKTVNGEVIESFTLRVLQAVHDYLNTHSK